MEREGVRGSADRDRSEGKEEGKGEGKGDMELGRCWAQLAIETCTISANFRATPRWATTTTATARGKWVTRVTSGSQLYSQWNEISRTVKLAPHLLLLLPLCHAQGQKNLTDKISTHTVRERAGERNPIVAGAALNGARIWSTSCQKSVDYGILPGRPGNNLLRSPDSDSDSVSGKDCEAFNFSPRDAVRNFQVLTKTLLDLATLRPTAPPTFR